MLKKKQQQQQQANVRLLLNQFYTDVIKGTTKSTLSCQEEVKKLKINRLKFDICRSRMIFIFVKTFN